MDIREQIRFMEEREFQELNRIPEWARAEHMERNVPLKELWRYPDSSGFRENLVLTIFRKIIGFRKMKKNVIICHSAEEMNRKADALIEQGFQVEREIGVQPVQAICFPIYKVTFWK